MKNAKREFHLSPQEQKKVLAVVSKVGNLALSFIELTTMIKLSLPF